MEKCFRVFVFVLSRLRAFGFQGFYTGLGNQAGFENKDLKAL